MKFLTKFEVYFMCTLIHENIFLPTMRCPKFIPPSLEIIKFRLIKVYTDEGGIKQLNHGLSAFTGDNPLEDYLTYRRTNHGISITYLCLTLKAPITTAVDDIHKYFSLFSEKIRLDILSKSSARQRIHIKN